MVSYLSVVFCAVGLIGLLLQNSFCSAEQQQLAEPNSDLSSDGFYEDEKRGGGRAFSGFNGLKRGGGRAFNYYGGMDKRAGGRGFANFNEMDKRAGGRGFMNVNEMDKRAGGRGFMNVNQMDKRGGGRAFYGFNSYNPYPLVYKKADYYTPYYLETRGGARSWQVNDQEEERNKRAGARTFPVFIDESTEKRIAQ